jgi:hypothetical protein
MNRPANILASFSLAVSGLAIIATTPALAADPAGTLPPGSTSTVGASIPPGQLVLPSVPKAPAGEGQAPVGPLVYFGSCATTDNTIYHQLRTSLTFTGSRGQATIQNGLHACSGTAGTGVSLVNLANIEGNNNLAQCFMGHVTGYSWNYWYTPNNDGHLGNFLNAPRYQVGDVIQCTVTQGGSGWLYTLTNLTTGVSATQGTSTRGGTGGSKVWWGHETWNTADEMGGDGTNISITYPGYQYSGGGTGWFYAAGDSSGFVANGTMQSYWHGSVTGSPYDTISAYTSNH